MKLLTQDRTHHASRLLAVTAAAALCALTAACGSDPSSEEPAEGNDLGTLTVTSATTQGSPFVVVMSGNKLGVWDDTGLDVKTVESDTKGSSALIASGKADILAGAGGSAVRLATLGDTVITGCVMGPWAQYLIVGKESGITSPEQLKGKTFGVSAFGVSSDYATRVMAKSLGFKESDYKVTALGDVKSLGAALKSGTIDAFLWSAATAFSLERSGVGTVLGDISQYVGETCFESFSVRKEVLEERPEAVKAFFSAYYDAVAEINDNPQLITEIFTDDWEIPAETADRITKDTVRDLSLDGEISSTALDSIIDAAKFVDSNLTDDKIDVDSLYQYWKTIK